jgi:hypothetical protein
MSSTTRNLMITSTAALFAVMATIGAAEAAQRGQKHHDNGGQKSSHNVDVRHGNNDHRNRHVRRGIGGIYLSLGNDGGCSYSYRKWKATGSQYWRARYNDCRNG